MTFPDEVQITNITIDENYRTPTEGVPFNSRAYVEEDSEIRYGNDGQPLDPVIFIGLPKGTTIKRGDYICIIQLHGEIPNAQEARRRPVKRVARVGAYTVSHLEVMC